MEKWLCWGAMGASGIMFLLFVLDMVTKSFPFGGLSTMVDILVIAASALVLYLSWDASRDLR